ncbi:MAG: septum formation protein Maf [FCB group bacterium]|nr:septum formation protein Maf [FCB group bacterium]
MNNLPHPRVPLILASASPRRKQLLTQAGFQFTCIPAQIHEDFALELSPVGFSQYYAKEKARVVARNHEEQLIIGADTIVVLDNMILGKPKDRQTAIRMLSTLSGKTHRVITGVTLIWKEKQFETTFHECTEVTFQELTQNEIGYYIDHFRPFDKAGSYGIQDWFALHVSKISGCFYNVVGFPLSAFYHRYKAMCDSLGITVK